MAAIPCERPHLRNGYLRRNLPAEKEDEDEPLELLDFEYYGAAQWLKAAEGLFDINTRPWLRDLVDYYRDWTIVANGAGIDKDEQIEGEPDLWNEIYFKLAARCLSGLSPEQAGSVMPTYFDQLPDESLFDNLKIFLGESDELFFTESRSHPTWRCLFGRLPPIYFGSHVAGGGYSMTGPFHRRGISLQSYRSSISTLMAGLCGPRVTCSRSDSANDTVPRGLRRLGVGLSVPTHRLGGSKPYRSCSIRRAFGLPDFLGVRLD